MSDLKLPKHISGCGSYGKGFLSGMEYQRDSQWVSVDCRLPPFDVLVLVYTPPFEMHDGGFNFDHMCEDYEYWYSHSENREHFLSVALPEGATGPGSNAKYTHWMTLPDEPKNEA